MKSRYVIIAVVIGIIIIAWISFRVSFGTTNPFYVFTANTMAPTLKRGDVLVIRNSNGGAPFSNLKIGDIIVWRQSVNSEGNPSVAVVSRISDIQTNSTKGEHNRIIKTHNDNSTADIKSSVPYVTEADYIGKVVYVIPKLGFITKALAPPVNYIIIIGAIVASVWYIRKRKNSYFKRERS